MTIEANKAVVRRYIREGVNRRDYEVIDELLADERMRRLVYTMIANYSDLCIAILDMIAEGDTVAARLLARGRDAVSGRMVEVPANNFYKVVDGRIVGYWPQVDSLLMMQQIGVVPESLSR